MAHRFRVQVYLSPRSDTPERLAQQIFVFLAALEAVHPSFTGWQFEELRTGKSVPVSAPPACQRALVESGVPWKLGAQKRISYRPRLWVGPTAFPEVEVNITCGVEPIAMGPVFVPNRLEVLLRAAPGDERATPAAITSVLRAAVALFRADFGHAGSVLVPQPAEAIFSDGTPVVGWLTYLSTAFGPMPKAWPSPAAASQVGAFGTLIAACPDLFDDRNEKHLAAVSAVRDALSSAGCLAPLAAPGKAAATAS